MTIHVADQKQTCIIVGLRIFPQTKDNATHSHQELIRLAETAGLTVQNKFFFEVKKIQSATFIGTGQLAKIKTYCEEEAPKALVLFDCSLNPVQGRNLEKKGCIRVLDRTAIILDIFSQHAQSLEGMLQVELAQYQYLLPRLIGQWSHFSKQRGGSVGLRGPGETQLEIDRRQVRNKITRIQKKLEKVKNHRRLNRQKREAIPIPLVCLIGYTNAGKSTLFNQFTKSQTLAEDKLFATLDPKTKVVALPKGRKILVADTVGFIQNLPHELVAAFESTFEETRLAHLILHVIDASQPNYQNQILVVEKLMEKLGLHNIPYLKVFNKMDLVENKNSFLTDQESVALSALKGDTNKLAQQIEKQLRNQSILTELLIPYSQQKVLDEIYRQAEIVWRDNQEMGVRIRAYLNLKLNQKFKDFHFLEV